MFRCSLPSISFTERMMHDIVVRFQTFVRKCIHLSGLSTKYYSVYTRKVEILSLAETIKEKSTFRAKARRRSFARNVDFSFIVSGSERTSIFRVSLNTLPTLATLVRDIITACILRCHIFCHFNITIRLPGHAIIERLRYTGSGIRVRVAHPYP